MPRYTGLNNKRSPFEQLGGKLHGKNYLDLIFPLKRRTSVFIQSESKIRSELNFYVRGVVREGVTCIG